MKKSVIRLSVAAKRPRLLPLDEGTLVLPPVTLLELPPEAVIGFFLGVVALRFTAPAGTIAVFLHDLRNDDIAEILASQRRQAEAQLGADYGRQAPWWERQ